jgi:hypothetical protein
MNSEHESIEQINIWVWSEFPKAHKVIGLKCVFKVKRDAYGNVVKHKARLVAKEYAYKSFR